MAGPWFSAGPHFLVPLGFALGGREAVGGRVPKQIGQDDRLGLGADEDGSLLSRDARSCGRRAELPDFAAAVDVHQAGPGKPLRAGSR